MSKKFSVLNRVGGVEETVSVLAETEICLLLLVGKSTSSQELPRNAS